MCDVFCQIYYITGKETTRAKNHKKKYSNVGGTNCVTILNCFNTEIKLKLLCSNTASKFEILICDIITLFTNFKKFYRVTFLDFVLTKEHTQSHKVKVNKSQKDEKDVKPVLFTLSSFLFTLCLYYYFLYFLCVSE